MMQELTYEVERLGFEWKEDSLGLIVFGETASDDRDVTITTTIDGIRCELKYERKKEIKLLGTSFDDEATTRSQSG